MAVVKVVKTTEKKKKKKRTKWETYRRNEENEKLGEGKRHPKKISSVAIISES